ncbi:cytochrome c [Thermomonas sp.]|uniref:cytochrome c n=1 Tax=Thermomonas sp. TaxID=1971895 RepID=UPI0039E704D7
MKIKETLLAAFAITTLSIPSASFADSANGQRIFVQRCAMCHGTDIRGTGPLARRSVPPTPDLTTPAFKRRLADYPGVIVSSVILRPNGDRIPRTLRENGVRLPAFTWTVQGFRDLNEYMTGVISRSR